MHSNLEKNRSIIVLILVAMSMVGCGGGGGGGGGSDTVPKAAANSSVMGLWTITQTSKTSADPDCAPPNDPLSTDVVYISQRANDLTVMFADDPANPSNGATGGVFTGAINAGAVSLTGSSPDGSGVSSGSISATVAVSCNSLTGSSNFTFTQASPAFTCAGSTQFTGTRSIGNGCAESINNTAVAEARAAHNTPASAQTINLGSAIAGSVPSSNSIADRDIYKLVLAAATPVTVMLTGPAAQDLDLGLFASNGTTLLASSVSDTSNEAVSQNLAAGTYFIAVQPFTTGATNYTLVVQ
jgi:hypothetical protein